MARRTRPWRSRLGMRRGLRRARAAAACKQRRMRRRVYVCGRRAGSWRVPERVAKRVGRVDGRNDDLGVPGVAIPLERHRETVAVSRVEFNEHRATPADTRKRHRHSGPNSSRRSQLQIETSAFRHKAVSGPVDLPRFAWRNEQNGLLYPKPGATLDGCGWLRHARARLRKRRRSVTNLPRRRSTYA